MKTDLLDFGPCEAMKPPRTTEKTRYLCGISGGKDSTALLLWMLHDSGIPKDKIICTFSDTGNEHDWTYAHVEKINKEIHPVITLKPELDFYELALKKKRFPSTKARFCTQVLKIYPTEDYIEKLKYDGYEVISCSGVRADESEDRKNMPEWDMAGFNVVYPQWRPIIKWKYTDVVSIHEKHKFPLNPLYDIGSQRVGCYPCIMSRKAEVRTIAIKFPDRIDMIREAEEKFEKLYGRYSSFFPASHIPERFRTKQIKTKDGREMMVCTINDVVKWSMTGKGAKGHFTDEDGIVNEAIGCMSGFCE